MSIFYIYWVTSIVPYCISWEGDEEQQEQEPPSKLHTTPPFHLLPEDCSQWRNKVSQPLRLLQREENTQVVFTLAKSRLLLCIRHLEMTICTFETLVFSRFTYHTERWLCTLCACTFRMSREMIVVRGMRRKQRSSTAMASKARGRWGPVKQGTSPLMNHRCQREGGACLSLNIGVSYNMNDTITTTANCTSQLPFPNWLF